MVRLEHVNLVVKNIDKSLEFILTAFPDWQVRGTGETQRYGKKQKWLHLGTGEYYLSLNEGEGSPNPKEHSDGLAHIGFEVDDMESIAKRLKDKGYEVTTIGADHPFRKTSYFADPAGIEYEFIEYLSHKPAEKNMYGGETTSITRLKTNPAYNMAGRDLVQDLYKRAVDGKNVAHLSTLLSENVRFRLGNFPPVIGKHEVLESNRSFFSSIKSMAHTIDNVWTDDDQVICNGIVDYVRLNGTDHSAFFSTVLTIEDGKITDYLVYADLS
ncbi:VOC family protein [Planctobacterium marinum]|uniref:VOC family protein n=1 Tax=Planctobacterium marinum TaxID=1631968 RepID=UPI001E390A8E|nr:VOC family protein [Planctobacterium marinum]MCC2605224.1 VOC family protein [Planctobacterium marinum]